MKRRVSLATGAVAVTLTLSFVGPATEAGAVSCDLGAKWTARTLSSSEKFDANAGCNGVWAIESYVYNDQVRGRFYKDGAWQTSSYSWQWVYWNGASQPKIVGNTTTGRDIKGQAANYDQYVIYEF